MGIMYFLQFLVNFPCYSMRLSFFCQFSMLSNCNFAFFFIFREFSMLSNGKFASCHFPMLFNEKFAFCHFPFLGSGTEGVDDLCFHTYGEFSPPPSSSFPLYPSPQPPGPYLSLEAHIPASKPKFQSRGPNPTLKAQIPTPRPSL